MNIFMATDRPSRLTFILEPARRGSKKLNASVMTASGCDADRRIRFGRVPLYIRRAARAALDKLH